ncbi:hypothetical protein GCM10011369_17730 [Neiella marina]|uniref:DUF465 domain-containing protein n=1 Tax=Neiella marina TaxID=508461 RepID=A0A8J2XNW7_9GAMM|nr:YdcH family protein [Neiella marina]GGA76315.1 hypothetical protein GCM10011369_17730 [Neiella marina]
MLGEDHSLVHEFPEYSEQINQLKQNDQEFAADMRQYDELDRTIRKLELANSPIDDTDMHQMKHDRSALKDSLYRRLQRA